MVVDGRNMRPLQPRTPEWNQIDQTGVVHTVDCLVESLKPDVGSRKEASIAFCVNIFLLATYDP